MWEPRPLGGAAMADNQLWEVVGGASTGGILVRAGRELKSAEASSRLESHAVVRQLELKGERLNYQLVSGDGPQTGWVSLTLKGKDLLVKQTPPRRLLLLSIPWKGHIVHLQRVAKWFSHRQGYETHFGVFPQSTDYVPSGTIAHVARGDELHAEAMYDAMEESFREIGKSTKDHGEGLGSVGGSMMTICAKFSRKGQEPFAQFVRFCIRLIEEVQPDLVIGDSACQFYNILAGYCATKGVKHIWVQSPGLRELKAEAAAAEMGLSNPGGEGGALQKMATNMGIKLADLADAMGLPTPYLESLDKGVNAPMPPGTKLTFVGLVQVSSATPDAAPFLAKPMADLLGISFKAMMAVIMKLGAGPLVQPCILPSSSSLVGQPVADLDLFTGSFLPLPNREAGTVRRNKAAFEAATAGAVDGKLIDWLYAEEDSNPVLYIAFGTIVQPSVDFVRRIHQAVERGGWRVLWSLPDSLREALPSDLCPRRWRLTAFAPQAHVLKCERVRAFVSHMGANSTTESLACGVPMVCCPFYMDQYEWSSVCCEHWGAGVQVDRCGTADHLHESICRVVEEPRYAQAAEKAAEAMYAASEATLKGLSELGGNLEPPEGLGVGVSVAAALAIRLMNGEPPEAVWELMAKVAKQVGGPEPPA